MERDFKAQIFLCCFCVLILGCDSSVPESSIKESPPAITRDTQRWYVYNDAGSADNHGFWTNWMPEISSKMINLNLSDKTNPHSGTTCVRISLNLAYPPLWCGIAVACQPDYWGEEPSDSAYDLNRAIKLVFRARGESGGESVQIKVAIAGDKPYGDSAEFPVATRWLTLKKKWQRYELSVAKTNLRRTITPFSFVADIAHNPSGKATFYLDEIYFEMVPLEGQLKKPIAPDSPQDQSVAKEKNQQDIAHRFLVTEMDRWTEGSVVYDEYNSGGHSFFPSNWMGDIEDLRLEMNCQEHPAIGRSCVKITYVPRGENGFAGIFWVYPGRQNWGEFAGRNLQGASSLKGKIRGAKGGEVVDLTIGGINRSPSHNPNKPFQDSFGPIIRSCRCAKDWKLFDMPLPRDAPLNSVIGGFGITFSKAYGSDGSYTIYLDDVSYDNRNPEEYRLIRSYVDSKEAVIHNASFLYDNILCLIYFLSRSDEDSLRRARILANTLIWAQEDDGSWRNAYSCGSMIDPESNTARLPGYFDEHKKKMIEDRYMVSNDTGNVAWTMIALLAAHCRLETNVQEKYPYLQAAIRAAEWVESNCRADDDWGGYTGGFEGWENARKKLTWRSTEHSIDLTVAFMSLAHAVRKTIGSGHEKWIDSSAHARKFVLNTWDETKGCFLLGVKDNKGTLNLDAIPSDAQTWAILAMAHDPVFRRKIGWAGPPEIPRPLQWVEQKCRVHRPKGYLFSNKGEGIWFEGAAHLAAAYHWIGNHKSAERVLQEIVALNHHIVDNDSSGLMQSTYYGGIFAAYPEGAYTGLRKEFFPGIVKEWTYPCLQHIGASVFYLAAANRINIYWLAGSPERWEESL